MMIMATGCTKNVRDKNFEFIPHCDHEVDSDLVCVRSHSCHKELIITKKIGLYPLLAKT